MSTEQHFAAAFTPCGIVVIVSICGTDLRMDSFMWSGRMLEQVCSEQDASSRSNRCPLAVEEHKCSEMHRGGRDGEAVCRWGVRKLQEGAEQ